MLDLCNIRNILNCRAFDPHATFERLFLESTNYPDPVVLTFCVVVLRHFRHNLFRNTVALKFPTILHNIIFALVLQKTVLLGHTVLKVHILSKN